jgi:hypothetical protein
MARAIYVALRCEWGMLYPLLYPAYLLLTPERIDTDTFLYKPLPRLVEM